MKHALFSVFDDTGMMEFALRLQQMGWRILVENVVSSDLADFQAAGVNATDIRTVVHEPILNGHFANLSQEIHVGLLVTDDREVKMLELAGLPYIDLLCVNMAPLRQSSVRGPLASDLRELPRSQNLALLHSAAMGRRLIVTHSTAYSPVTEWLQKNEPNSSEVRRLMGAIAEWTVMNYTMSSFVHHLQLPDSPDFGWFWNDWHSIDDEYDKFRGPEQTLVRKIKHLLAYEA